MPFSECYCAGLMESSAGNQMALQIEMVVDGVVKDRKRGIDPGDLNRPIRRSRRRVGLLSWFCKQTTAGQWMRNFGPIV